MPAGAGHDQLCPGQQRQEELPDRYIETEGRLLQDTIVGSNPVFALCPPQPVDDAVMLVGHAFGFTSGTRGINHIGQVLRRDGRHYRIMFSLNLPVASLQIERRHRQLAQQRPGLGLHQHRHRRAVFQHVAQSLRRIPRIQRHIGTTRLQNTQQAHHHFQAALRTDRDPIIRLDTQADQIMCQSIRPGVEFAIGQASGFIDHRQGIGLLCRLFLEQLMEQLVRRVGRCRIVERLQYLPTLLAGQQRQFCDRLLVIRHHAFQKHLQVPRHPLDRCTLEQIARVFQRADQPAIRLDQRKRQVELGRRVRRLQRLQAQLRQAEFAAARGVVQRQHDLEDRAMTQAARWLQRLHHLLERQVLMVLGA